MSAAAWLEYMCSYVLPAELHAPYAIRDCRGVIARELGLDSEDWRVLDEHYENRRRRREAA